MLIARSFLVAALAFGVFASPLACGSSQPEPTSAASPAASASGPSSPSDATSASVPTTSASVAAPPPAAPRNTKVCAAIAAEENRVAERTANPRQPASYKTGACAAAAKAFESALSKSLPKKTDPGLVDAARDLFACEAPWATALEGVKVKDGELTGRLVVDYLDDKGKVLVHGGAVFEHDPKKPNVRLKLADHIDLVADFVVASPADGPKTLGITLLSVEHEGPRRLRGELWHGPVTAPGGKPASTFVESDPKAAGLGAVGFADVDGDGRLDVLYQAPFVATVVGEDAADHEVAGPLFVAHALGDGSFAAGDAVAKDAASCACPGRPDFDALGEEGDLVHAIACARVWNVDAKAAVEKLCAKAAGAPRQCKQTSVRKLVDAPTNVTLP